MGCKIYNAIWPGQAQHCPGGVCEIHRREPIQQIGLGQIGAVAAVGVIIALAVPQLAGLPSPSMSGSVDLASGERDCTPPALAVAIGHEERWKLHNGCI